MGQAHASADVSRRSVRKLGVAEGVGCYASDRVKAAVDRGREAIVLRPAQLPQSVRRRTRSDFCPLFARVG